MKRFFAGLLAVCLVGAAFAGCSGSSANYNVNDVASAVETVAKIENPLDITEDTVSFPWFPFTIEPDAVATYTEFVCKLCDMARRIKRVSGKAVDTDNDKYAFRYSPVHDRHDGLPPE